MRYVRPLVVALLAATALPAGAVTAHAPLPPVSAPATTPQASVETLPSGLVLTRLPDGTVSVYNPFLGMVVATSGPQAAPPSSGSDDPEYNDANDQDAPHRVWNGMYDSRLAGGLRSKFYRPLVKAKGPGKVEAIAGGACDGASGRAVAIDPATVRVDKAGRVFWLDENDNAHFKGLPYVRVLGLDGKVRTIGNIGGPMEGRHWRDGGTASGMARIVPDDKGGVYFDYLGYFSIGFRGFWSDVTDDLPRTTVIGHLKADGTNEFVSGRYDGDFFPSGNYGNLPPNGDGGPYADAKFNWIYAMTADAAGNFYVVDGNPPQGTGTGAGAPTNQRSSTTRPTPSGHVDSRPVVVRFLNRSAKDVTFYKGTPNELTVKAGTVATVAGVPPQSNGLVAPPSNAADADDARKGQLVSAPGIVIDRDGNILLLQIGDSQVRLVAVNTGAARRRILGVDVAPGKFGTVAGTNEGYGGDGGKAVQALFDVRQANQWWYGDLALDRDGAVVVADTINNRVRRIDRNGIVRTLVGNGDSEFDGDGKAGDKTGLSFPMGVAVAANGDVLVADWLNARLRRLDHRTNKVSTLVGNGSPMGCGDGGKARTGPGYLAGAGLGQPHDAVEDSKGNVYVADIGLGVVRRIAPDGTITTVAGRAFPCTSAPPSGQGYLASCPPGVPSGDGGPPAKAVLQQPGWLLVDRYDNLYISDGGNVRYVNFRKSAVTVQDVTVQPGTIATVYAGEYEIRKQLVQLFPGADQTELTVLVGLAGIAVDGAGTLYVADLLHSQVVQKTWCGAISPVAGNGVPSSTIGRENDDNGDGGPAVAATVTAVSLAWDEQRGVLFMTDLGQGRVRAVNMRVSPVPLPQGSLQPGFIETFAGGGQCSGTFQMCTYGDGRQAREGAFMAPYGITAQPDGRVFVSDGMGALVRVVERNGVLGTIEGVTPQTPETDVNAAFIYWYGGICGEGGVSYRACVAGGVAAQVTRHGDLLVTHGGGARVQRIVDAVHAPLRPLIEAPAAAGAGWRFSDPLRLHEPTGLHTMNPTIGVDANGHAVVYATRMTDDLAGAGCAMWRVDIDRDGSGRDTSVHLGSPGTYGDVGQVHDPLFGLTLQRPNSCSVAVAPAGASALVPPTGPGQRVSYSNTQTLVSVGTTKTGAARTMDGTFVPSPTNAVTGGTLLDRAWVHAMDADTFGMGFCCTQGDDSSGGSSIGYATSVGGVEYVLKSTVATETRTMTFDETVTDPTPVTRNGAKAIVMAIATRECFNCGAAAAPTDTGGARFRVARSTDDGLTWALGAPVFSMTCYRNNRGVGDDYCQGFHGMPQIAADGAGTLYATFDDQRHVFVAHSTDLGATWSAPHRVDRGLSVAAFPTLVAGVAGSVDVAFLGTTSPAVDTASRDPEWYVYLAQTHDAAAAGRPHWTQSVADDHPVHRTQLGLGTAIGTSYASYGDFIRVAIDPRDGHALIAYQEDRGIAGHDAPSGILVTRQCTGDGILGTRKPVPCAPAPRRTDVVKRVAVACPDQAVDPVGDAVRESAKQPALDVVRAGLAYDHADVVARLQVDAMSLVPPTGSGGQAWTVLWDTAKGRYFLRAEAGADAAVSADRVVYSYGTLNPAGGLAKIGTAYGAISGNRLTMWVPGVSVGGRPALASGIRATTETVERGTPQTVGVADAAGLADPTAWELVDRATATKAYAASLTCAAIPHTATVSASPAGGALPAPRMAGPVLPVAPAPVVVAPASVASVPDPLGVVPAGPAAPVAPAPVPVAPRAVPVPAPPGASPAAPALRVPVRVPVSVPVPVTATARTSRAAVPAAPLLPCLGVPPKGPPPDPAPPAPVPPKPPAPVPQPQPVRPPVGQPLAPPEPPVQPVGPNPAGAPAPQPQPQPQQQPGTQQQLSQQLQPGQQAGMAAADEAQHREARAYTASRHDGVSPALLAWGWTAAALAAAGTGAAARRRRKYAYSTVRGRY